MRELSHWEDAPSETSDLDTIGGTEQWLSGAVGSRRAGKVTLRGLGITVKPEIVPWGD